jgi:hypothetical protein
MHSRAIHEVAEQLAENERQQRALLTLTSLDEPSQIYLSSFERNTDTNPPLQHLIGTFTVLGSMRRGGHRDTYTIRFFEPSTEEHTEEHGQFWCSCPSHTFGARRYNMVCKHICFLVCRVGRIYDANFFRYKHLTREQHAEFMGRIESSTVISAMCQGSPSTTPLSNSLQDRFRLGGRTIVEEDTCPICCDAMTANEILCCPECANNMHRECMHVWLERQRTCVYCRSDVWRFYRPTTAA